jgi:MFS family permease
MVSDASRKTVLTAAALGSSLAPFMVSAFIVALPSIGREFSADAASLGWVTSIFFLSAAVFLVPVGRIADMYGIKKVFTIGIGVYILSAPLCILSADIQVLIAARFVTGIGAGMIFGTSIALISLVYPEAERGRAIGINVTAMAVGFLLGFFLGGLLTFYAGWRSILVVTIPFEILILWLIMTRIRGECEVTRRQEPDFPGMALYSTAIFFLMVGISLLPRPIGGYLIPVGLISLAGFVVQERRSKNPLLDPGPLFRNRIFVRANVAAFFFNTSNFGVIFLMSLYLQAGEGIDARLAGVILLVPIIFMAGLSPYAGRLSDRIPPRIVICAGVAMTSLSLAVLTFLGNDTPLFVIILALVLIGAGIALFQSPLVRTLISSVPRETYGLASGLVETMRLMGMTVSIAIALIVFALARGTLPPAPAGTSLSIANLHTIFWILFAFSIVSLAVAAIIEKRAVG